VTVLLKTQLVCTSMRIEFKIVYTTKKTLYMFLLSLKEVGLKTLHLFILSACSWSRAVNLINYYNWQLTGA